MPENFDFIQSCPVPILDAQQVLLAHGGGGTLMHRLLSQLFLPAFANEYLDEQADGAILRVGDNRLAFTTDGYVVQPLFFPGGDIGTLAVNGTVNDLAMCGARPLFLSAGFIIEEGLPMEVLRRVTASMRQCAIEAGVLLVTGDTKVVEKGSGDGVFITTSGIGLVAAGVSLSASHARPGDAVILSGPIGNHGIAILTQRAGLELESTVESDSAPLHTLVEAILGVTLAVRCMRDPTRGGLASTLNEIATQSKVGIAIEEAAIPVDDTVRGACELLGLDPLYVANEGKLVAVVPAQVAGAVVAAMRAHPLGAGAAVIGQVRDLHPGLVTMRTAFGTTRVVDMLAGDQLPRIC